MVHMQVIGKNVQMLLPVGYQDTQLLWWMMIHVWWGILRSFQLMSPETAQILWMSNKNQSTWKFVFTEVLTLFSCFYVRQLKHVLAIGWTSVCLSVCPSHASIVSKRLNQSSNCLHCLVAHDSNFEVQTFSWNSNGNTLNGSVKCKGEKKVAISDRYLAISS